MNVLQNRILFKITYERLQPKKQNINKMFSQADWIKSTFWSYDWTIADSCQFPLKGNKGFFFAKSIISLLFCVNVFRTMTNKAGNSNVFTVFMPKLKGHEKLFQVRNFRLFGSCLICTQNMHTEPTGIKIQLCCTEYHVESFSSKVTHFGGQMTHNSHGMRVFRLRLKRP